MRPSRAKPRRQCRAFKCLETINSRKLGGSERLVALARAKELGVVGRLSFVPDADAAPAIRPIPLLITVEGCWLRDRGCIIDGSHSWRVSKRSDRIAGCELYKGQ